MNIANNLKIARQQRKLSPETVAKQLGVGEGKYASMEVDGNDITFGMLDKFAQVFEMTVYDLLNISRPLKAISDFQAGYKFFDQLIEPEEITTPFEALTQFFSDYKPWELRRYISEIVEVCVTSENTQFDYFEKRADLLNLYRQLLRALEAANILVTRTEETKRVK
ncbi:MAG TPA: helix-turn-helix transcriptional regulator [Puia sp.]|jgi:transcriptional regulator with XRE-family HTH domain